MKECVLKVLSRGESHASMSDQVRGGFSRNPNESQMIYAEKKYIYSWRNSLLENNRTGVSNKCRICIALGGHPVGFSRRRIRFVSREILKRGSTPRKQNDRWLDYRRRFHRSLRLPRVCRAEIVSCPWGCMSRFPYIKQKRRRLHPSLYRSSECMSVHTHTHSILCM